MRKPSTAFVVGVGLFVLGLVARARGQLVISEVYFDPPGVNTGRQVVELRNVGDTEVNMRTSGYWLYFLPARWQFPPGVTVAPGQVVTVHVNRPGVASETEFFTGISGMRSLRSQSDAIALFSTDLFGDPTKILDFVQWGGAGNGGEEVAVAAEIWPAGGFVSVASLRAGASIAYDGSGSSPADWCVDGTPTTGAPNDGCSPSFAQSPVILNEVGYVRSEPGKYHPAVELKNVGSVLEDLGGKWIVLGGQHSYRFPLGTPDTLVGPGEIAVLHLGASGTDRPLEFFTGAGTFRDLNAVDSVSFHAQEPFTDATAMLDFVQWGAAGSPLEPAAVAAQLWGAGEFVNAADRRPRGSIAARGTQRGVTRWVVDNTGTISRENDAPPEVPVALNEVLLEPAGANAQRTQVELKNQLPGEVASLAGFKLCVESSAAPGTPLCYAFPQTASIAAGGFIVVNLNRSGINAGCNLYTGPLQDLNPALGSLLLLVSGLESDPNNLIDYVSWGGGDFGQEMAAGVGIWPQDATVDVSLVIDGSTLAYSGEGDAAESWRVDHTPSMCQDNREGPRQSPFRRGDCNDDRKIDISDAIFLLTFLFAGGKDGLCADACDTNDDDSRDISDPVYLLNHLFGGGPEPKPPGSGPDCGLEPLPLPPGDLTCGSYLSC